MFSTIYTYITLPIFFSYRGISSLFWWKWNTKVTKNLYMSGAYILNKDISFLEENDIFTIINLAKEIKINEDIKGYNYYEFDIKDGSIPSVKTIKEIYDIIKKEVKINSNIQINCAFGSGRSTLIILYYLVKSGKYKTLEEAIKYLKSIRPQIGLNYKQKKYLKSIL